MVQDYNLVCFSTLTILEKDSVWKLLRLIDKTNGYVFGSLEMPQNKTIFDVAYRETETDYARVMEVQEKYLDNSSEDEGDNARIITNNKKLKKEQYGPYTKKQESILKKHLKNKQNSIEKQKQK